MRISVRLFAGLREQAGVRERSLEVSDGVTVADIWPLLELGEEPSGLLYAVNRGYAARETALHDGDEVALIPPVSGGAFRFSEMPLSLDDAVREVASDDAGAIATFSGTTRAHARGRAVIRLEYEAYEGMAEETMAVDTLEHVSPGRARAQDQGPSLPPAEPQEEILGAPARQRNGHQAGEPDRPEQ